MAGYAWLYVNAISTKTAHVEVCLIKKLTNVPCPSCGSTRSMLSILNGEYWQGLKWNPLGFISLIGLMVIPPWIVFDFLSKSGTFISLYYKIEKALQKKRVAIPLIVLMLINWWWNIYKGI
jgi:hypothetical protein